MSTTLSADFTVANPNATVWDIVHGLSRFGAVHAMVDLRCADHAAALGAGGDNGRIVAVLPIGLSLIEALPIT